jgi:uncharacterized protein
MKTNQLFKLLFLTLSIAFSIVANAQTKDKIAIGHIDLVPSNILNEDRFIWIHVPEKNDSSIFSPKRYPVVYLLDGEAFFTSFVGLMQHLNLCRLSPEMIVVGITNTNRTIDLTPTHKAVWVPGPGTYDTLSGGGEKFMGFIEKELMPYIDAKYPTEPYKMLIGHSLGGLTVVNTLIHHTDLFNAYVAIDPSLWWDDQKLLKEAKTILSEKKFDGKSLYLSIANTMTKGMNIEKTKKDTTFSTLHIRSLFEFKYDLETNKQNGLKSQSKYYPDDSHGSVPLISEYDALHFLFDFYPLNFEPDDYKDKTADLADKYEKHYAELSKQMGYKVKPHESEIIEIAHNARIYANIGLAERFFKLSFDYYPESFYAYDAYGNYLLSTGDTKNAKAHFKKSLSLKENEGIRKKLEDLIESENTLKLTPEALQLYTGEFVVTDMDMTIKTYISKDKLMLSATGHPDLELYSTKINEFKAKNMKGFLLKFQMSEDKLLALEVTSLTGTIKALPK